MPYRKCQKGDTVFVRATVIEAAPDVFQVRFEDSRMAVTTWVPSCECARLADLAELPLRESADGLDWLRRRRALLAGKKPERTGEKTGKNER
jgi:hypothetical protein